MAEDPFGRFDEPVLDPLGRTECGSILENLPICTFRERVDPDTYPDSGLVYRSPQADVVTGYTIEEYGPRSSRFFYEQILHPDDRERVWAEGQRTIATGELYRQEYRIINKAGQVSWVLELSQLLGVDEDGLQIWDGAMLDITDRRQAELALQETVDSLKRSDLARRRLLADLVGAEEAERKRIAEDLHDDCVQHLTALALRMDIMRRDLDGEALDSVGKMHDGLKDVIARLRGLMFDLRPGVLEDGRLSVALRVKLEEIERDTGVSTSFVDHLEDAPAPSVAAVAYRLGSECLTNARKHAHAASVEVELSGGDDGVKVTIRDDGIGFDPSSESPDPRHMGLASMRERAESAGGWLECCSTPGEGAVVRFWIPT